MQHNIRFGSAAIRECVFIVFKLIETIRVFVFLLVVSVSECGDDLDDNDDMVSIPMLICYTRYSTLFRTIFVETFLTAVARVHISL